MAWQSFREDRVRIADLGYVVPIDLSTVNYFQVLLNQLVRWTFEGHWACPTAKTEKRHYSGLYLGWVVCGLLRNVEADRAG